MNISMCLFDRGPCRIAGSVHFNLKLIDQKNNTRCTDGGNNTRCCHANKINHSNTYSTILQRKSIMFAASYIHWLQHSSSASHPHVYIAIVRLGISTVHLACWNGNWFLQRFGRTRNEQP
jgi:hypothetical protein